MKKIITLLLLIISLTALGQDKIYYDANWNETTSKDYVYYRPLPLKKVGDLLYIQDYFRDGQLQYQGYSYSDDENARVGDAYWYTEEGYDSSTANYENLTDTKELTYYYQNGKEWKKILYNNRGKKRLETVYIDEKTPIIGEYYNEDYYGTFIYRKFRDDYYSTKRNRHVEKDSIKLNNQKKYLPNDILNYSEVIYWSNGNKAKEVTYTKTQYSPKVSTSFWDEKGNILSQMKEDYNNPKGTATYKYYTKFGIAQSVKIKDENLPKDDKWSTQKTTYYLNGKVKEINKSTWKNTEIYSYDEKGKESIQLLEKDRKPYDGFFTDTISNKVTYFQMVKGQKIGEVITKNFKADTIVAKGVFKDNKPYEGTFYFHDKEPELLQYKNGLQNGEQIIYTNYYADIPEKVSQMKQGVLDGYKRTYKDGVVLTEETFKNGVPVDGAIIEGNVKKIYKNAQLFSIEYYRRMFLDELRGLYATEYYKDELLDKVVYTNFRILDDTKTSYIGYYKQDKPYNGYFMNEDKLLSEIFLVDYYQNGTLLYQYSYDFLYQLDSPTVPIYNNKAIYKDGKITDGYRYYSEKNILISVRYRNSIINQVEINGFGMHAFNRVIYEYVNNELIIKNLSTPVYIKLKKKDKYLTATLYNQDGEIASSQPKLVKDKTPNSIKIYYIENNTLKNYNRVVSPNKHLDNSESNYNTEEMVTTSLNIHPFLTQTPLEYFQEYTSQLELLFELHDSPKTKSKREKEEGLKNLFIAKSKADASYNFCFLHYDDLGNPSEGIDITNIGTSYTVDFYSNGKKLKTSTYKNLNELKKQDLMVELLNIPPYQIYLNQH